MPRPKETDKPSQTRNDNGGVRLNVLHFEKEFRVTMLGRGLKERTDLTSPECRHLTAYQMGPVVRIYGVKAPGLKNSQYVEIPFTRFQYWSVWKDENE